jgi:hypothetical protein
MLYRSARVQQASKMLSLILFLFGDPGNVFLHRWVVEQGWQSTQLLG